MFFDLNNRAVELYDDGIGKVEYVQHMGSDLTIVNSARVSFGQNKDELDNRDKRLIKYLIKNKHTSTLEHNVVTFKFTVPLFIRSQHHRHRTWSYNEISRRYTDINIKFYEPASFRTQHESDRQASSDEMVDPVVSMGDIKADYDKLNFSSDLIWGKASSMVKMHHSSSLELYNKLIEAGVCREQARGILPQNMYTEYYGTVNLSNLLKFVGLRMDEHAQWEIRKVAEACLDVATKLWPVAVNNYREINF